MKAGFFPWKDQYKLGVEEIDIQHMKLFEIINRLFDSFISRKTEEELKKILDELIDYTIYHFSTEEKFLKNINYPKFIDHQQLHETFKVKVTDFRNSFNKGNKITSSVMNFLKKWLDEHILKADRDYVNFVK